MSIRSLEIAKELKIQGKRLGRAGLAERVFALVDEFNKNRTYKNAIVLAGKLKAISQACNFDGYWSEKNSTGFHFEAEDLHRVGTGGTPGTLPEGQESWWIK